jgi:hypothetical protein
VKLRSLDFDFDVDAGWELKALQRVDGLWRRLEDVEEALVDLHLEVLAAVLVLVRAPDDGVHMLLGWQRHGTDNLGIGANNGFDDFACRLVDDFVIVRLETDTDFLLGVGHGDLSLPSYVRGKN